jgi:hypothetical protein
MIRSYALAATAVLAAFTNINAWAADPLPTEAHKVLTAALAVEAAQTAIATCKGQGYNVSVYIVAEGRPDGKLREMWERRSQTSLRSIRATEVRSLQLPARPQGAVVLPVGEALGNDLGRLHR